MSNFLWEQAELVKIPLSVSKIGQTLRVSGGEIKNNPPHTSKWRISKYYDILQLH